MRANSRSTSKPNIPELGIETRFITKMLKEKAIFYGRLKNQYKLKHETVFSAKIDKQEDDKKVLDETELFILLDLKKKQQKLIWKTLK